VPQVRTATLDIPWCASTKPYRPAEIFDCLARHLRVRYRRGEALPASPREPLAELRPEDFSALPQELRNELSKALISLDRERIAEVIQRVSERNVHLGAADFSDDKMSSEIPCIR
jgi:hypothetical protein